VKNYYHHRPSSTSGKIRPSPIRNPQSHPDCGTRAEDELLAAPERLGCGEGQDDREQSEPGPRYGETVRKARLRRPAPEVANDEIDPGPSPLEEVMGAETLERYEAALARLGEEERAAVVMRVDLGCSYAEIAEALGRPSPDAARMAVGRALVRLAREMREGARGS